MFRNELLIEVDVRVVVTLDDLLSDFELPLQRLDRRLAVERVEVDVLSRADAELVQIAGRLRPSVIGGENDDRVVKPYLLVDESEEIGQRSIEP